MTVADNNQTTFYELPMQKSKGFTKVFFFATVNAFCKILYFIRFFTLCKKSLELPNHPMNIYHDVYIIIGHLF